MGGGFGQFAEYSRMIQFLDERDLREEIQLRYERMPVTVKPLDLQLPIGK